MDFVPPAFVQQIGNSQYPRFVYRDAGGQYFTGSGWSNNPSEAALYHHECDAVLAMMQYAQDQRDCDTYTATIVVTTARDAWSREDLMAVLKQAARAIVSKQLDEHGIATELIWDDLMRVVPYGEKDNGSV